VFIEERDLLGGCLFLTIVYKAGFLCVLNEGQCEPALLVILADSLTHERSFSVD